MLVSWPVGELSVVLKIGSGILRFSASLGRWLKTLAR